MCSYVPVKKECSEFDKLSYAVCVPVFLNKMSAQTFDTSVFRGMFPCSCKL